MLKLAAVGLAAGVLSGLFGVGGGVLIVPGLVAVVGMEQRLAHGTSLAATLPLASAGVIGFALDGEVDLLVALTIAAGAGLGAVIGTDALQRLPVPTLKVLFAGLLVLTAARMLLDAPDGDGRGAYTLAMAAVLVGTGLFAGTLAGLLGIGGGIVMVPVMTILLAMPNPVAKGSSLAVIIFTASIGTLRNRRKDNVEMRTAAIVGGAGVVSSFLAARVSIGLDPTVAAVLFAVLLVASAARMLQGVRSARPAAAPEPASGSTDDRPG